MAEPIIVDNLVLDGEAVHRQDGEYLYGSHEGWKNHFRNTRKRLPSVAEYIVIFKTLHARNDPALEGIIHDLCDSSNILDQKIKMIASLSTRVEMDYGKGKIPMGSGYADDLINDPEWKKWLEDKILQYDVRESIDVLQQVSGKRLYVGTPDHVARYYYPKKAVELAIGEDKFLIKCWNNLTNCISRARGIYKQEAVLLPTKANILSVSQPYVCGFAYETFEKIVPEDAAAADILIPARDLKLVPDHSWTEFEQKIMTLYKK